MARKRQKMGFPVVIVPDSLSVSKRGRPHGKTLLEETRRLSRQCTVSLCHCLKDAAIGCNYVNRVAGVLQAVLVADCKTHCLRAAGEVEHEIRAGPRQPSSSGTSLVVRREDHGSFSKRHILNQPRVSPDSP